MFLLKNKSSKGALSTAKWVATQSLIISGYWLAARLAYVWANGRSIDAVIKG